MEQAQIDLLSRIARAVASQFGPSCEVVVHDLEGSDPEHTIVCIENGQVSGRKVGDGASRIVLDAIAAGPESVEDRLCYLARTPDGKVLKSSTVFVRDEAGRAVGVLGINYDVTVLKAAEDQLAVITGTAQSNTAAGMDGTEADTTGTQDPETIARTVNDLLDELIAQSVQLVGVPVELMGRADKIRAIRYLDDAGAFLIKHSGPKVCEFFGISKYTLYNYLDQGKSETEDDDGAENANDVAGG